MANSPKHNKAVAALPRIMELCLSPSKGGLELYMVRAAHFLGDRAISVIRKDGQLGEYFTSDEHTCVPITRYTGLMSFVTVNSIMRLIDEHTIAIVHVHFTKDLPLAVLACGRARVRPKLIHTRSMMLPSSKNDFYHRWLYSRVDCLIAITQQVARQIKQHIPVLPAARLTQLYFGAKTPEHYSPAECLATRHQLGITETTFVVGIVGRIEAVKGQSVVLDAVHQMRQREQGAHNTHDTYDTKALVVGHAMEQAYGDALATDYASDAIFTGFTNQVYKYMHICDVLVLATREETFGMVLVEAMRSGVCVVASDSGGPLEVIEHGVSGLLFKTMDSHDLATQLTQLQSDTALRTRLAAAGKARADALFDEDVLFEQMCVIFSHTSSSHMSSI